MTTSNHQNPADAVREALPQRYFRGEYGMVADGPEYPQRSGDVFWIAEDDYLADVAELRRMFQQEYARAEQAEARLAALAGAAPVACDVCCKPLRADVPINACACARLTYHAPAKAPVHTWLNHDTEPHCIGCYVIDGLSLVATCNECGHAVDLRGPICAGLSSAPAKAREDDAKDARRYRFLRREIYMQDFPVGEAYITLRVIGGCPASKEIDAAIDAALATFAEGAEQ